MLKFITFHSVTGIVAVDVSELGEDSSLAYIVDEFLTTYFAANNVDQDLYIDLHLDSLYYISAVTIWNIRSGCGNDPTDQASCGK